MWLGSLVPSAADDVRRALDSARGAIRFDEFMSIALYGEHGFYTSQQGVNEVRDTDTSRESSRTGRAGRRGDFLTSPEVGPLFGTVIAQALDTWWQELGQPRPYVVVEAGAGPGTLARSVLSARMECAEALEYRTVELSAAQRALHPSSVISSARLPSEPFSGVILANELLDNLPFRLFVHDDGWKEAYVARDGERFVEQLVTPAELPACLPLSAGHGARCAVHDAAVDWVAKALGLLDMGRVVAIDYCTTTASMSKRPWREWLRTYREHERGAHYFASVGEQDITVEVAVDQLPVPDVISSQSEFLRRHSIDELVEEGRTEWQRSASSPDLTAMTMRSRIREAEALLDPKGLGGFSVLEWNR
jgi:SAM-dependent MidA family methyltransferase